MTNPGPTVLQGDVWQAELDPVRGHEQGGTRPVLVISTDGFNAMRAGLVAIVPLSRTLRPVRTHVLVEPPEGGLSARSDVLCEQLWIISQERLNQRRGRVTDTTLALVLDRIRPIFGF
jgi:mRNA interferase MazF